MCAFYLGRAAMGGRPSTSSQPQHAKRGFAGSNEDLLRRREGRNKPRTKKRQSDIGLEQRRGSGVAHLFGGGQRPPTGSRRSVDPYASTPKKTPKKSHRKLRSNADDWLDLDNDTKINDDDSLANTVQCISPEKGRVKRSKSQLAAMASAVRRMSPRARKAHGKELAQMPFEEELRRTQDMMRSSKNGFGHLDGDTEASMIKDVQANAQILSEVLQARQSLLRTAKNLWQSGDVVGMVLLLQHNREKAVMVDILNNIGARTLADYEGNTVELVRTLLPIAEDLLASRYEDYIIGGLRAIDLFIKATASDIVDAARESADISRMLSAHECCAAMVNLRSKIEKLVGKSDPITHRVRRILSAVADLEAEMAEG